MQKPTTKDWYVPIQCVCTYVHNIIMPSLLATKLNSSANSTQF